MYNTTKSRRFEFINLTILFNFCIVGLNLIAACMFKLNSYSGRSYVVKEKNMLLTTKVCGISEAVKLCKGTVKLSNIFPINAF